MNTHLTSLDQELADLVKSKGLVLRKDIVRLYGDKGVPKGTVSARLSVLSYELNVIKQCKISGQGTFVYWPGTKNILYELGYDFCQGCACVFNIHEMDDGICPICMDELQEESGDDA